MTTPLRAWVATLDDAALETLANKGLLRRARADAATATLVTEADDGAEMRVEGETVRLTAAARTLGVCTCPAPGVCRHQVAAVLVLRDAPEAQAPEDGATAKAAPDAEPSPSVGAADWPAVLRPLTPARLERFAGAAAWRDAQARADSAEAPVVAVEEAYLTVRLSADVPAVLLPASGDLDAALTKASPAERKAAIAAAVLVARRVLSIAVEPKPAVEQPVADRRGQDAALTDVTALLDRAFAPALSLAPLSLEDELRRAAVACRAADLARLSALLRRAAAAVGAHRRREADADPGGLLLLLAEAAALTAALQNPSTDTVRERLLGEARQTYQPVGDLHLFGLGAALWRAPTGANGVTAWLYDPAGDRSYTATQARPDGTDRSFDPRAAFRQAPVWGHSLETLAAGELKLADALASDTGRLSSSSRTRASASPWRPTPQSVAGWPCVFDDWPVLQAALRHRLGGGLTAGPAVDWPVVLRFSRFAPARFDELEQTLIWPVADRHGRWIGLTLDHEGYGRDRIEALEDAVAKGGWWAVLATAARADEHYELRPYALWGEAPLLLDFAPRRQERRPMRDGPDWLARLRAGRFGSSGPDLTLSPARSATEGLLDEAWSALLSHGERGHPSEAGGDPLPVLAARLADAGLNPLASIVGAASGSGSNGTVALRAAWAIHSGRLARSALLWMRPSARL